MTPEVLEIIAPLFTSIDPLPPTASREEIHRILSTLGYRKDEATAHVDQMVVPERNESIYALSTSGPIGELIWTKRYHSEISVAMYLSGEAPPEDDKMLALWSAICEELRVRYGKPSTKKAHGKKVWRYDWTLPDRQIACWWWCASAGRTGKHESNVSLQWSFATTTVRS